MFDLESELTKGTITRRQFLRYTTLLGFSAAASANMFQLIRPRDAAAVAYGGKLKVSGILGRIEHPARSKWLAPSQVFRNVLEYLTFTDANNITRPYLLRDWHASQTPLPKIHRIRSNRRPERQ